MLRPRNRASNAARQRAGRLGISFRVMPGPTKKANPTRVEAAGLWPSTAASVGQT